MIVPSAIGYDTSRRILDYLYRRQGAMIELLHQLVKLESPSTVAVSQEPVLSLLAQELMARQFRVRRIRGRTSGGHLLAVPCDRQPQQPIQLLIGHSDTVWPLGTLATTMPWVTKQGKIYGPGVYDMKGGLVQMIFAVEALIAQDLTPAVAPVFMINSDEEIGSGESTRHIQRLAQIADRAFVMEPSLGPTGKLKTRRRGAGDFTVRVQGKAAHAGLNPEKGISAILELSYVIQNLFALNDLPRGISVNVGNIDGGIRPNVIAPTSQAVIDVRVLHPQDAVWIEDQICSLQPTTPGTQLQIDGHMSRPPMEKTPGNGQLWQQAQQTAAELGIDIDEATAGGGSDGNTTSLFTPTLDGLGAVGDEAHAPGEFLYQDQLVTRSALLSRLLLNPQLKPRGG